MEGWQGWEVINDKKKMTHKQVTALGRLPTRGTHEWIKYILEYCERSRCYIGWNYTNENNLKNLINITYTNKINLFFVVEEHLRISWLSMIGLTISSMNDLLSSFLENV